MTVGLPLGVDPDEIYVAEPVHFFPGDTLVLFTDGLVEDSRTRWTPGWPPPRPQSARAMSATSRSSPTGW